MSLGYELLAQIGKAEAAGKPLKRIVITPAQLIELRAEYGALRYYDLPRYGVVGQLWGVPLVVVDNLIAAAQRAADLAERNE